MDKILIRGARTHNLKNIDLTLPRDKLIVITGLSGSPANHPWRLTRCMPKASDVMSSHCQPMRGSFCQ